MRAFMLEVPESLLEERRRMGADLWDEVWDGVLHMVPAPSRWHQRFGLKLCVALDPVAEKLGLEASYETAVYRPNASKPDYRTPDLVFYHPSFGSKRGVEGNAKLVIEILSPGDETYEKLPFYAEVGVEEVLVVHPETRAVELFLLQQGEMRKAAPDAAGSVRSAALGVTFTPTAEPKLRVTWTDGSVEI